LSRYCIKFLTVIYLVEYISLICIAKKKTCLCILNDSHEIGFGNFKFNTFALYNMIEMKRYFLLLIAICSVGFSQAQIPQGYYDSAEGLQGYALKTALFNIIRDFNVQSYSSMAGLYRMNSSINGFKDLYYENDQTVLDIYSENPDGSDPYNYDPNDPMGGSSASEGLGFNREHIIPQSYFDEQLPMRNDVFHVWPVDGKVNGWRSNFPHGTVANANQAQPCNSGATNLPCKSQNGSLVGKYTKNLFINVFEPIDEFKGDVARAYFYFATCYQDRMNNFYNTSNAAVGAMFDGSNDHVFDDDFLETLIEWHIMDPVSQREQDINNLIYQYHQGNRNPFIDHPEYVYKIWAPDMNVEDLHYQERESVVVYNSGENTFTVELKNPEKSIQTISVFDMTGQLVQQQKNLNFSTKIQVNLSRKGVYILKAEGEKLEYNAKIVVK